MSENELYGMMAVAQEQQKTAERHQKALQSTLRDLRELTDQAPQTFSNAATEALTGASSDLSKSVKASREAIEHAASHARNALTYVNWLYLGLAFLLGLLLATVVWGWFLWDRLDLLQDYLAAIWGEVKPPKK